MADKVELSFAVDTTEFLTQGAAFAREAAFAKEAMRKVVTDDQEAGNAPYNTADVLELIEEVSDESWHALYNFFAGRS